MTTAVSSTRWLRDMFLLMVVSFPRQTSVGQVSRVDASSKVEVVWADNSMTIVLPQVIHIHM